MLMKVLACPLDQHVQALKPVLQMLKVLEPKPTLLDWRLDRAVTKRTWIAYRSTGLYALAVPGKEQDSQETASNAASPSRQHVSTVERCFQRPHLIPCPDLTTREALQ